MREFLHVDDLAEAVRFTLETKLPENIYNVGFGSDLSIKKLAETIQKIVGHKGQIIWDLTKSDDTPRKWIDSSKLRKLGWEPKIDLETGVRRTYVFWIIKIHTKSEILVKKNKIKINNQK